MDAVDPPRTPPSSASNPVSGFVPDAREEVEPWRFGFSTDDRLNHRVHRLGGGGAFPLAGDKEVPVTPDSAPVVPELVQRRRRSLTGPRGDGSVPAPARPPVLFGRGYVADVSSRNACCMAGWRPRTLEGFCGGSSPPIHAAPDEEEEEVHSYEVDLARRYSDGFRGLVGPASRAPPWRRESLPSVE